MELATNNCYQCNGKATEIFFNEQWYYPKGVTAKVTPPSFASVEYVALNTLHVVHTSAPLGQPITVELSAKL